MRILEGDTPISSLDVRAFSPTELKDGWRLACRAIATTNLAVEVPPMVTRPKAATVGVGRQVILRPSLQKRYLEMEEPTLEDQASDLERVLREIDDLDVTVSLEVLRDLGKTLRTSDFKVTAVISDDELIDVEPGDTTASRHGMAFDLGTTTVVATLMDLGTGDAGRGRLDAEQAAALRRRRDHAHLGHDARSRRARAPARPRAGDARRARPRRSARRAASRPRTSTRSRSRGTPR